MATMLDFQMANWTDLTNNLLRIRMPNFMLVSLFAQCSRNVARIFSSKMDLFACLVTKLKGPEMDDHSVLSIIKKN